jgi:hypothetical protein
MIGERLSWINAEVDRTLRGVYELLAQQLPWELTPRACTSPRADDRQQALRGQPASRRDSRLGRLRDDVRHWILRMPGAILQEPVASGLIGEVLECA